MVTILVTETPQIVNTTGPAAPLKFYPLLPNSFLTTALTNTLLTHSQYLSPSLSLFLSALSGSSSPSTYRYSSSSSSHFFFWELTLLSVTVTSYFIQSMCLSVITRKSKGEQIQLNQFPSLPVNCIFHFTLQLCLFFQAQKFHHSPTVVPSLALPPASSPISVQYIHNVFPSGFSCQFSFNISLKYNGYFTACFLAIAGEEILGHKFCQISQNSSQSYCLRVWKY